MITEEQSLTDWLRNDLATPLPRSELLTARDLAAHAGVDPNTIHVWTARGILHPRQGRYDWREAELWLLTRNTQKITAVCSTRNSV